MDRRRLADIRAGRGNEVCGSGSGYLVGPTLVLTARHVVAGEDGPFPRIVVHLGHPEDGSRTRTDATVCWRHPVHDLALLRIDRQDAPPVRWGRPVGKDHLDYEGLGFPLFAEYDDGSRWVEPLTGTLNAQSATPDGYALDQRYAPALDKPDWRGVSGTAVFTGGLLTAVVTKDDRRFDRNRLRAVPAAAFVQDPEFTALLRADTGLTPFAEPVELAPYLDTALTRQQASTPGSLLAAPVEAVEFTGRQDTLDELRAWRDSPHPFSVLLVTGEGGQGKTRLAREFARRSRADGWLSGFTVKARRSPSQDDAAALAGRLADVQTAPVLVVSDYAEAHPDFVAGLTDHLLSGHPTRPVRLLLLSRTAGAWWQEFEDSVDQAASLALPSLESGPELQRHVYETTIHALTAGLEALPEPAIEGGPVAPWQTLGARLLADPPETSHGNILTLQMAALLDLLELASGTRLIPTTEPLERRLATHERDYLSRSADAHGLFTPAAISSATNPAIRRGETLRALDRSLAALILLGPCDHRLATAIASLASEPHAQDVLAWLEALYPPPLDLPATLGQILPDRLGDHLLARILTETRRQDGMTVPTHPDLLFKIAPLAGDLSKAQSVLFTLTRAAALSISPAGLHAQITSLIVDHPTPYAAVAPFAAVAASDPAPFHAALSTLVSTAPSSLRGNLATTMSLLPEASVTRASFNERVTDLLTRLFRDLTALKRDVYLPDLAISLNNHALRLAEVGRRVEALSVSREAVTAYRELAALDRDAHLRRLAMSLNNHALRLAGVGQRAEALSVSREAVDLRRELVSLDRDAPLSDLADSLNNHALRLTGVGRRVEALSVSREAVTAYRELAALDRDAHLPGLATSLSNDANRLSEAGRWVEALSVSREAVDLRRELVSLDRDAHLFDLADSLNNHALRLGDAGRRAEALPVSREAVTAYRELAALNRDAHLPALAGSLSNHASLLAEVGRRVEALPVSREAVTAYRELAALNRDAHLPGLVRSLAASGYVHNLGGRSGESILALQEALTLVRELPDHERDILTPVVRGLLRVAHEIESGGSPDRLKR